LKGSNCLVLPMREPVPAARMIPTTLEELCVEPAKNGLQHAASQGTGLV